MKNGHYTTYCLNSADRRWYHYNDTVVTPVDDEVVARAEAYLLFYEVRGKLIATTPSVDGASSSSAEVVD